MCLHSLEYRIYVSDDMERLQGNVLVVWNEC